LYKISLNTKNAKIWTVRPEKLQRTNQIICKTKSTGRRLFLVC